MAVPVLMPALSPTMEEGKLSKWLVKEGDTVSSGDVIAEIETDKATMEVEAVDDGKLARILVPDGSDGVKVNTQIAIISMEGDDENAVNALLNGVKAAAPAANAPVSQKQSSAGAPQAAASRQQEGERVFASPLARRIAEQNNVNLTAVNGTGPHGRIVKADVENAMKSGGSAQPGVASKQVAQAPQTAQALPAGQSDAEILALFEAGSYEIKPIDGMRKVIAKRLLESKTTVPHFYLSADIELDALLELRQKLNERSPKEGASAYKLSVNDFVIKAVAMALRQVPDANVTWTNGGILQHRHSDIGVAVSIEGGLITPVVRKAEQKSLTVISGEMKDLAARARSRKLAPQEYQGGTTAVSNLGMYKVKNFSAIINPPHATIFAVGAGEQRPVVKNGVLAVANLMTVTVSTDHRVVDGALGADLLNAFKQYIEDPIGLLV